jgi:hypothetical protein
MAFGEDKTLDGELCKTVQVSVNKQQFAKLAEALTEDIPALLGDAAKGMTEFQLLLIQRMAKGIFTGLDAEGSFLFYIQPSTGRIVQIETVMDMANPFGSRLPGANPRVVTKSKWTLYGFGEPVESISP